MVNQPRTDTTVSRRYEIPEAVRAFVRANADYFDVYTLEGRRTGTPEQWARAAFEDVVGRSGQFIWRGVLGLRLEAAPTRVAGWAVVDLRPDLIRLEARSRLLIAHLVVHVDGSRVTLVTALRYRRPLGRRIWEPLSAIHRRLAPGMLRDAHAVVQKSVNDEATALSERGSGE